MEPSPSEKEAGTYFGLCGIDVGATPIVYPRGIVLRKAYAHLMRPLIMAFAPAEKGKPHPGPWKETRGGTGHDISAELHVPSGAAPTRSERIGLANTIIFLLRLWAHPSVELVTAANMAFAEIPNANEAEAVILHPPLRNRHFKLIPVSEDGVIEAISWTVENFETCQTLMDISPEFRLAATALDLGQTYEETAMTMVSLWGALEAIFSPSASELRFRVSALIAAFLYPPGHKRLAEQRRIAKLYDKRSAAAHGRSSHSADDLLQTFELVRKVLIAFLRRGSVPSREELEAQLFGAS